GQLERLHPRRGAAALIRGRSEEVLRLPLAVPRNERAADGAPHSDPGPVENRRDRLAPGRAGENLLPERRADHPQSAARAVAAADPAPKISAQARRRRLVREEREAGTGQEYPLLLSRRW